MNLLLIFLIAILVFVLWSLWGTLSSRVEQTAYSVIKKERDYELRLYPAHLVAQTTVEGSYQQALTDGFRIVAGYIFGGNEKKERIAMTAPVVERKVANEKIAMTAPVLATLEGDAHTIAFGMPRSYTLSSLPSPTDSRVQLVTIAEKKMAALRFSWFRSDRRVQLKKEKLLSALRRDGVTVNGEVQYAGYNAPGTPPWMIRNEVLVEVR